MSSEISTNDAPSSRLPLRRAKPSGDQATADQGLQPWQFFVLAALGCATAVTFISRGQGFAAVILGSVLMAGAALAGMAALRMVRPLLSSDEDRTIMIGQRTRTALEREKLLTLRTIKELEFDRAMGRLSDADWQEMSTRLRARAARLIKQLDSAAGYREQIERDLEKRLGSDARADARTKPPTEREPAERKAMEREPMEREPLGERTCSSCSTPNDADARFCKECGQKL